MKYIAYFRVSTAKQEASGDGLNGQHDAVAAYVAQHGGQVVGEYVETESGAKDDRPQLQAALAMARAMGATLLIAKIDRLARDVAFLSKTLKEGVPMVACDMPHASTFVWHIRGAVAEEEQRMISERTKAALQAAKRRGKKLGWAMEGRQAEAKAASEKGAAKGGQRSAVVRAATADGFAKAIGPLVQDMVAGGASLRQVAAELNAKGVTTPRGKAWQATSVKNLLARVA